MPAACSSKTRMNSSPMISRFRSGSVTPLSAPRKPSVASTVYQVEVQALEHAYYRLRLTAPHQPVVHEHAGELVADGAMHEGGGDRGVDAAGQRAYDLALANGLANLVHRALHEVGRGPFALTAAYLEQEVLQQRLAQRRVLDLGVELDSIRAVAVAQRRYGRVVGMGQRLESRRGSRDVVAVAHPHRERAWQTVEEGTVGAVQVECGRTVLSGVGPAHAAAELVHHRLHPVANAQQGKAAVVHPAGGKRRALLVDAGRSAGEDNALRV